MKNALKSLGYAFRGIGYALLHEQNVRVQVILGVVWTILACMLGMNMVTVMIIVFVQSAVLGFEMGNSAVELLLDVVKPRLSPHVAMVKNMLAGMVFIVGVAGHLFTAAVVLPSLIERLFQA